MHLERRFRLLMHQRGDENTEYDRNDDDGHTPVTAVSAAKQIVEELDNPEN